MIEANKTNIIDLLDKNIQYKVPENQRNFEWKKSHAEDFWEDISTEKTFLGTFVINTSEEKDNKQMEIVDGQQRLTTIFILLSACRNQAKKTGDLKLAIKIQERLTFSDATTAKDTEVKFITSPSIQYVFEKTITNSEWSGDKFDIKNKKREVNRIKPLYSYFAEKISKYDQKEISDLLTRLYDSTVVIITLQETKEAFEIFERMNARGMELNAADLLKNYLFSQKDLIEGNLKDRWQFIIDNSTNNIIRMIKHFYVSKLGYIQKKALFDALKKYGKKVESEKMLSELEEFSYLHQLVINSNDNSIKDWADKNDIKYFTKQYNYEDLNRCFEALKLFKVSQVYPVIVKALTHLSSIPELEEKDRLAKKFLNFVKTLETYHFINNAIAQRPGNEVEKNYADRCSEKIKNGEDLSNFFKNVISDLTLVKRSEFVERFTEINYENDFILIYYIYDRLYNRKDSVRKGGQFIKIYNPNKSILKKNFNIEHLIPQKLSPEYNFTLEEIGEDLIHNIGNLLIISSHTNPQIGNAYITKKFSLIKEKEQLSPILNTIKELSEKDWSSVKSIKENINKRSESLGKIAYDKIWLFN